MGVRIEWNCVRNGGTVNGAGTISTTAAVGSAAVPPESIPVKKGHEFSGWYTSPNGGTIYSDVLIEGETTFYAQFIPREYTIAWDYGDGQGEATLQEYGKQIVLPENPVKKGYAFKGWYTEDGVRITGDEIYMKDGNSIYFARWDKAEIFSVTVPVSLLITVSEHGSVYSAVNAEIVNNSSGAVRVTSITVSGESGWRIVPYDCGMASEKVDSKEIGFRVNGASTESRGSFESLTLSGDWTIDEGMSLPLAYDAVVSAMSEAVNEQVLTIIFAVEWAK